MYMVALTLHKVGKPVSLYAMLKIGITMHVKSKSHNATGRIPKNSLSCNQLQRSIMDMSQWLKV